MGQIRMSYSTIMWSALFQNHAFGKWWWVIYFAYNSGCGTGIILVAFYLPKQYKLGAHGPENAIIGLTCLLAEFQQCNRPIVQGSASLGALGETVPCIFRGWSVGSAKVLIGKKDDHLALPKGLADRCGFLSCKRNILEVIGCNFYKRMTCAGF